jgi:Domain of unknown function (DUF4157)
MRKLSKFCVIFVFVAMAIGFVFPQFRLQPIPTISPALTGNIYLPQVEQITPPTPDVAWGETGATVLPLAAQIMSARNPQGVRLDATQKSYLRPLFGNLVDRATVVYHAKLLDRWSQGGKETHIGGVDSSAQTYCDRIYIRARYKPHDTDMLVLLAHELTHFQQCTRLGGISKFGESYFQGYYQGGQTYQDNPLEQSARKMERNFTHHLCTRIGCPPTSGRYYVNYKGWGIKLPVNL